ncbi:MAG: TIGR03086 family metal-binding protein, partial [Nocardioidaceae bacterium]
ADHLIHAWDLAAATNADTALDEDLVAEVAAWFADREQLYRSGGAVGAAVDNGDGAQARLLGAFGRSATWTPR